MIRQAFKRLWNDKRGNVLVIAGLATPLLFGSVGLATDTIQWALWNRQIQRSADSAAYSGVYARFQSSSSSAAALAVVNRDLTNAELTSALKSGYPLTTEPVVPGLLNTVEVRIDVQRPLIFSSMFLSTAPTISVTGRAAAAPTGSYCVVALENDRSVPGIVIQGSANVTMGCGMISNSPSASVSVDVIGSGHQVTAEPVAGVGGVPQINGVTQEQSFHLSQPDPYANLHSTAIPFGTPCTSFSDATKTNTDGTKKPGCYSNFDPVNGSTTTLSPGVYYLNNASINIQASTRIVGTGVTLIFTGTNPGTIETTGNSVIDLTAPTTGPYAKMLMIQSTAAALGNESTFTGNSGFKMDGVVYFPKGKMTFTGSSGPASKCAMVVARRVHFSGSTNIQNETTGCSNGTQIPGYAIRLIA